MGDECGMAHFCAKPETLTVEVWGRIVSLAHGRCSGARICSHDIDYDRHVLFPGGGGPVPLAVQSGSNGGS